MYNKLAKEGWYSSGFRFSSTRAILSAAVVVVSFLEIAGLTTRDEPWVGVISAATAGAAGGAVSAACYLP